MPEWILADTDPNPQNAPLVNTGNNCKFNFSARKLDFAIEQGVGEEALSEENVRDFTQQVGELSQLVITELDLSDFSRIGFRVWYMFPCESTAEAEKWLNDLGCYNVSQELKEGFKGEAKAISAHVIIESEDRKFRVAFSNVERNIPLNLGDAILSIPAHTLAKRQREHLLKQIRLKKRLEHNPQFAAMIDIDAFLDDPEIVKPGEFVQTSYTKGQQYLEASVAGEK